MCLLTWQRTPGFLRDYLKKRRCRQATEAQMDHGVPVMIQVLLLLMWHVAEQPLLGLLHSHLSFASWIMEFSHKAFAAFPPAMTTVSTPLCKVVQGLAVLPWVSHHTGGFKKDSILGYRCMGGDWDKMLLPKGKPGTGPNVLIPKRRQDFGTPSYTNCAHVP